MITNSIRRLKVYVNGELKGAKRDPYEDGNLCRHDGASNGGVWWRIRGLRKRIKCIQFYTED